MLGLHFDAFPLYKEHGLNEMKQERQRVALDDDAPRAPVKYQTQITRELPVTLQGELFKKGRRFGFWKRQHMSLRSNVLCFHRSANVEPYKIVPLAGYRAEMVAPADAHGRNGVLLLVHPTQRTYRLAAATTLEACRWVSAVNRANRTLRIDDLDVLELLGKGGFGAVYLARKKDDAQLLAVKQISKRLNTESEVRHVIAERVALQAASANPYAARLRYAFESRDYWFLCTDHYPNGDLFAHFRQQPTHRFDESVVQLWTAQIVHALAELHAHGLVHRDIKLENVLLDADFHVRLADFGFAKSLDSAGQLTNTFCGTPSYMAPELVRGAGLHGQQTDLWSLGVLVFQLLAGHAPFRDTNRNALYDKIANDSLDVPDHFSPEARSLVGALMRKSPYDRLGAGLGGMDKLRAHDFFRGIDWSLLAARRIAPRYTTALLETNSNKSSPAAAAPPKTTTGFFSYRIPYSIHGFSYTSESAADAFDSEQCVCCDEPLSP